MVYIIIFLARITRIKVIHKGSSEYISTKLINAKMLVLQQSDNRRKHSDFLQLILCNLFIYAAVENIED